MIDHIEKGITITVYADYDYFYEVVLHPESQSLNYHEVGNSSASCRVSFGSIEQMEAVAKAMLQTVKFAHEQ